MTKVRACRLGDGAGADAAAMAAKPGPRQEQGEDEGQHRVFELQSAATPGVHVRRAGHGATVAKGITRACTEMICITGVTLRFDPD